MKYVFIFLAVAGISGGLFFFMLRWDREDQFDYQREMLEMCLNHTSESSSSSHLCSHIAYTEIANISREYSTTSFLTVFFAAVFGLTVSQAVLTNRELKELRKRLDA